MLLLSIMLLTRVAVQHSAHGGRFATRTHGSGLRILLTLCIQRSRLLSDNIILKLAWSPGGVRAP